MAGDRCDRPEAINAGSIRTVGGTPSERRNEVGVVRVAEPA